jgi:CzcA family heavy metal efflux pump
MRNYNVTLDEVQKAAQTSNSNTAGGYLRNSGTEYLIRGQGRVVDIQDLSSHVIAVRDGTPITLSQVATVTIGPALRIGDAIINGKPAVLLNVVKQPWSNTLATTAAVEKALSELSTALPKDVQSVTVFRQADFIDIAVHNVLIALVLGGICVAAVLTVFLRNWRTALISLTAIPLSLLVAILALHWQGGTINTMTLAGLAIAIGEVVDDAIIDVENVFRRLRENASSTAPRSIITVVYDASCEIRTSVVYATMIVTLVFVPVFFLEGLEGKIFVPLAFSYIVAIAASLAVALTVTPAMCYWLLPAQSARTADEPATVSWLKARYGRLLDYCLERPRQTLAAAALLFVVSLVPLKFLGSEFLPEFDESNKVVSVITIPGTSLDVMSGIGKAITGHLITHPAILAAGQRAGRAVGSDDYGGSNFSEFDLRLSPDDKNRPATVLDVRQHFGLIPGAVVNIGSYIRHRMDHSLSGVNAAIAIKVFGPSLPILREKAEQIEGIMRTVPGVVDAQVESAIPIPQLSISVNRDAAARYGVTVADLSANIETAFKGRAVSQVVDGQRSFDLYVWFKPEYREDLDAIKQTLVDTPRGGKVPIGSIASVTYGTSPNTIRHEMLSRLIVVQSNVAGRDLGSVIADIKTQVARQVALPPGYYVVYGGQFEAQEAATTRLLVLSIISCAGIFALLCAAFGSGVSAGLVLLNLPLALIGGIWAVQLTGGVLSIGSLVGFITLFGISTRNGIMLVSHFNHLIKEGRSFANMLREGALDRLSPVLMTALSAGLGVLPIALLGGAGRELEQPLAIVILGGMLTSTALTLLVLPCLFKLFGQKALQGEKAPQDQFTDPPAAS